MDIDRLRYFATVVKTRNLSRAAALLRISPPALSRAIKVLEGELHRKLMVQNGRGIAITDDGLEVAASAEKILQAVNGLRAGEIESKKRGAALRLGASCEFTSHFLAVLAARKQDFAKIEVHDLIPGAIEAALLSRRIDLGLTLVPMPDPRLDYETVGRIRMRVVARRGAFSELPFARVPFAVPIPLLEGTPSRTENIDNWPDAQFPRFTPYRVSIMESALELCRRGLAASYIPEFVVRLHNEIVLEPYRLFPLAAAEAITPKEASAVYLVKRSGDAESPAMRSLARAVRAATRSED